MRYLVKILYLVFFFLLALSSLTNTIPRQPSINSTNVRYLEKLAQFEQGSLREAFWTPDGKYIYVSGSLGLWRFNPNNLSEAPIHLERYREPVTFNQNNQIAASLDTEGNIIFWNYQTGQFQETFYDISERLIWITDLAFSPNGSQLAMGFGGGTNVRPSGGITIWNVDSKIELTDIQHIINDPVYLNFNRDGTRLVSGGYGGLAEWETNTWEQHNLPYGSYISNLEYNLASSKLAYWDWRNNAVNLLDLITLNSSSCRPSNPNPLSNYGGDIAFSPIDASILAISQHGQLAIWDTDSCQILRFIDVPLGDIAFSPNGTQLIGVNAYSLHLYTVENLHEIARADGFISSIGNMVFSENSELLAYESWADSHLIKALDTRNFSQLAELRFETNLDELNIPFLQIHVVKDSRIEEFGIVHNEFYLKTLLTDCANLRSEDIIDFIETTQSEDFLQDIWNAHEYHVENYCLSPNEQILVTTDHYSYNVTVQSDVPQTVRVWDIESSEEIALLGQYQINASLPYLTFSPDGQLFALIENNYANRNSTLRIWNTSTWNTEIIHTLSQERLKKGYFTNGNDMFITLNEFGDIQFWELQSDTLVYSIDGQDFDEDMLISPDGRLLAIKRNNTVELWGIPQG